MTLKEAIMQNEGLTNPRFLALAYQAVKEMGKSMPTSKIIEHILSKLKTKENITDRPEAMSQLKDAVQAAKRSM